MSNTTHKSLDALLGIEEAIEVIEAEVVHLTEIAPSGNTSLTTVDAMSADDAEHELDFQTSRKNIAAMIKNVQAALDSAILLAQAGDQPRAYEVVGGMLERLVNANKQLVELHKTKKDYKQPKETLHSGAPGVTNINIDKAAFVGKASDLIREVQRLAKENK